MSYFGAGSYSVLSPVSPRRVHGSLSLPGALGAGVHVYSNLDGVRQAHTLGKEVSFTFSTLTDTPVLWSIHIVHKGADNTVVQYRIEYEEW